VLFIISVAKFKSPQPARQLQIVKRSYRILPIVSRGLHCLFISWCGLPSRTPYFLLSPYFPLVH